MGSSSWLVRSTPDRVVRVRTLAEEILLCSYAQNFTLTVPLYTQARVVQMLDNAIHWINYYPLDSVVCFLNIYPLDSDLSGG